MADVPPLVYSPARVNADTLALRKELATLLGEPHPNRVTYPVLEAAQHRLKIDLKLQTYGGQRKLRSSVERAPVQVLEEWIKTIKAGLASESNNHTQTIRVDQPLGAQIDDKVEHGATVEEQIATEQAVSNYLHADAAAAPEHGDKDERVVEVNDVVTASTSTNTNNTTSGSNNAVSTVASTNISSTNNPPPPPPTGGLFSARLGQRPSIFQQGTSLTLNAAGDVVEQRGLLQTMSDNIATSTNIELSTKEGRQLLQKLAARVSYLENYVSRNYPQHELNRSVMRMIPSGTRVFADRFKGQLDL